MYSKRLRGGGPVVGLVGELLGIGHPGTERHALAGVRAPGDERSQLASRRGRPRRRTRRPRRCVSVRQYATAASQSSPVWSMRTALHVGERRLVGRDQARLGPPLDAHVADRHPALHGECPDGRAAVLHDVALAAAGADLGDQRQHDVLGVTPGGSSPSTLTAMVFGLAWGSVWVASTCSTSEVPMPNAIAAERPVGGGVRVTADHGHARLGQSELRADDVHDALVEITQAVDPDTELRRVACAGCPPGSATPGRRSAGRC